MQSSPVFTREYSERLKLAAKTGLAAIASLYFARLLGMPESYWGRRNPYHASLRIDRICRSRPRCRSRGCYRDAGQPFRHTVDYRTTLFPRGFTWNRDGGRSFARRLAIQRAKAPSVRSIRFEVIGRTDRTPGAVLILGTALAAVFSADRDLNPDVGCGRRSDFRP
jgi:hypothetical protein